MIQLFQLKNNDITEQMKEALESGDKRKVRCLLAEHGIFESGINFVSDLWNQAVTTLMALPDNLPAKQNLIAISQLLREKLNELERSRVSA